MNFNVQIPELVGESEFDIEHAEDSDGTRYAVLSLYENGITVNLFLNDSEEADEFAQAVVEAANWINGGESE